MTATSVPRPLLSDRSRDRRRLLWRYGVGIAIVVLLILAIGPRGSSGPPLDPRSTGPLGTRGIVDVLGALGADVSVTSALPETDDTTILVITDNLTDEQRTDVQDWVQGGGRLILADPFSELAPELLGVASIAFTEPSIEPDCADPAVEGVQRVAVSSSFVFELPAGGTGCFPRNDGFWMVRGPQGQGELITIGGPFTLTNELLDDQDTSVFLVNLLSPQPGGRVRVLTSDDPTDTPESLTDLLPDQVALALLQIPLAWLALVWWRGRRHGKPVSEVTPVRIEAAETTVAVGNLLYRAGRAADAAAIIRAQVHRELLRRLGLTDMADPQTFIAIAAHRTDLDPQTLHQLLLAPLPDTDQGLTRFANTAAHVIGGIRQRRTADPNDGSTARPGPSTPTHTGAPTS
ncbi:MAG: DUF4350 domain-containing protein [Euzebya sp.]